MGWDVSVRSIPSLLSQIKCIEAGGLLTELEKREIEGLVAWERMDKNLKGSEKFMTVEEEAEMGEEERIDFVIGTGGEHSVEVGDEVAVELERLDTFSGQQGLRVTTDDEQKVVNRLREISIRWKQRRCHP